MKAMNSEKSKNHSGNEGIESAIHFLFFCLAASATFTIAASIALYIATSVLFSIIDERIYFHIVKWHDVLPACILYLILLSTMTKRNLHKRHLRTGYRLMTCIGAALIPSITIGIMITIYLGYNFLLANSIVSDTIRLAMLTSFLYIAVGSNPFFFQYHEKQQERSKK